jgi:anti-sigma regulatory factor (Ser/Thr protein kinase)
MAMQEGYSTASDTVREMGFGAGMGLPNIKRNTDEMRLESEVNKGTSLQFITYI